YARNARQTRDVHGTSQGTFLSRVHRSVGKIFLLWNDGAARPLHGEPAAPARTRRTHRRIRGISFHLGIALWPALHPGSRLPDFRALLWVRLFYSVTRRYDRRSLDRTTQWCRDRRLGDECRSYRHDLRPIIPP